MFSSDVIDLTNIDLSAMNELPNEVLRHAIQRVCAELAGDGEASAFFQSSLRGMTPPGQLHDPRPDLRPEQADNVHDERELEIFPATSAADRPATKGGTRVSWDVPEHAKVVAFYACVDGVGRSSLVANLALMLASQGYRALVVDLDHNVPALYRYLSAFLPEPGPGVAAEPMKLTCRFEDQRGAVGFIGPTVDSADPARLTVRREDLLDAGYDFVLVDLAAGAESLPLIAGLADVVVLGYGLNNFMGRAARHAQSLRAGARADAIQILPVPMKVDRSGGGGTARMLVTGRQQFSWLIDQLPDTMRQNYWDYDGIPYEPNYATGEGLAFLDDSDSDQRGHLVDAYTRLATQIAPGHPPGARMGVTVETRARYREACRAAAASDAAVTVLHAPVDRYWAEWLTGELRRLGLTAGRERIDKVPAGPARPASALFVVSDSLVALLEADEQLMDVASSPPHGHAHLGVSVNGMRLPHARFPTLAYIDLAGKSEKQARDELASYYQMPDTKTAGRRQPHYPGARESRASNLPVRDVNCRGRDDEIDRIRDHFTASEEPAALTLTGPPGIGKSQLALEYAYRFADFYDLVFSVQADSVHAVRAGLGELANSVRPTRRGGDAVQNVLEYLQTAPTAPERWLLIYDGADYDGADWPDELAGLLPRPGRGHVLLTARTTVAGSRESAEVTALRPEAATAMLTDLTRSVPADEAARLASTLGGLPLAIVLTAGWLRVVAGKLLEGGLSDATAESNAVVELDAHLAAMTGQTGAGDPVRAAVELLLELLESAPHGNAARLLLETCAFLAPAGMSSGLLRSPGMLARLIEVDGDIADPVVLNNVRRTLVSCGFSVSGLTTQDPLQIHARVREILRERLSPQERDDRSRAVTQMLAASVPMDIDDDVVGYTGIYAELLLHVEPSGALRATDDNVRRWLVNQVRFLWQLETRDAWQTAAHLGELLVRQWRMTLPAGDDDRLLLRLRTQLANVYRSQCRFDRAREIDQDVLNRQRSLLGIGHIRTLMTARSYGADLRLVGDFAEALDVDQSTWRAFASILGDEHLMTIVASSNMALSELMYGYPERALERQLADVARCERIKRERPWQRPWVLFHVGTLQRELGLYEESRKSLEEAKDEFDRLVEEGKLASTVWAVLRTDAGLAITKRRLGSPAMEATRSALDKCLATYGDLYPDVLALELSLAGDLHAAGRHREAAEKAGQARDGYSETFGPGHPFTRISEVDLGIYALAAGDIQVADEATAAALSSFEEALNADHLWLQAAALARANVLATTGHPGEALFLEERARAEYRNRFGPDNELTRTAAINAANSRMLLNQPRSIPASEEGMKRRRIIELDTPPY